jgi:DNA-binding NarL/FixJ family response regulator
MPAQPRSEAPGPPLLTPRQERVARLVASGRTNEETAAALGITAKTVESHLIEVYRKLHVRSRTELSLVIHGLPTANFREIPDSTGAGSP